MEHIKAKMVMIQEYKGIRKVRPLAPYEKIIKIRVWFCRFCGHVWQSSGLWAPNACARCKRYNWKSIKKKN